MLRLLDYRVLRRFVTIGATLLLTLVLVPLSPVLVCAAWIKDRVNRLPESPTARTVVLVIGMLVIELVSMVATFVVAARDGFGLFAARDDRSTWGRNRALMGWYTSTQLRYICWVLRSPIDWRDHATLDDGPVIVMARHTSFFDALIPAALLTKRHGVLAHHVVTAGLQFAPLIDIVGHRFPNCFISRNPGVGSRELVPIEALGNQLSGQSGCIIFPEGTFRSPQRFERAIRRLGRRYPERAAQAQTLQHTLPPRPNGLWALLQGAPHADVVVCTNTGFEQFGFVRDIATNMPSRVPLVIETWRIPRAEIPAEFEAFTDWLFAEFAKIDAWVTIHGTPSPIETAAPETVLSEIVLSESTAPGAATAESPSLHEPPAERARRPSR